MKATFGLLRRLWKAEAFSPAAFLVRAAILAALYAVSCAAGLQEYTTFLSGTSPNVNMSWHTASTLGLVHLLLPLRFHSTGSDFVDHGGPARGMEWIFSRYAKPQGRSDAA